MTSLDRRRWWTKKAARLAFTVATAASRRAGPAVRVLTYHRFGHVRRDPYCVEPADFEAQVSLLARQGRAVSLDDVHAFARGQRDLPRDACLVTMDDGYASMVEVALPILQRHGVPAVAFVTAGMIDQPRVPTLPEPFLTKAGLRAMHQGGMVIGSHAFTHRSMGLLPIGEARDEVRRSRHALEEMLGAPVTSFAYPFGTHGDFNEETDRALEDAGYTITFHSQHGPIRPGMIEPGAPLASLPRIKIEAGKLLWQFELMTRGAMDAWSLVDHNLWRLQRVRTEITPSVADPEARSGDVAE